MREPDWQRKYAELFMAVTDVLEEFGCDGFVTKPSVIADRLRALIRTTPTKAIRHD